MKMTWASILLWTCATVAIAGGEPANPTGTIETYRIGVGGDSAAIGATVRGEAARDIYTFLAAKIPPETCGGPDEEPRFVVGAGVTCIEYAEKGSAALAHECWLHVSQADGGAQKVPMMCPSGVGVGN